MNCESRSANQLLGLDVGTTLEGFPPITRITLELNRSISGNCVIWVAIIAILVVVDRIALKSAR